MPRKSGKVRDQLLAAARGEYPEPATCKCGRSGPIDEFFGWRPASTKAKNRLIPQSQCFKCRIEALEGYKQAKLLETAGFLTRDFGSRSGEKWRFAIQS